MVMLPDSGDTIWRCLTANEGVVAELGFVDCSAASGVMLLSGSLPIASGGQHVQFESGESGIVTFTTLRPHTSYRCQLGASDRLFLRVDVCSRGGAFDYMIFKPDDLPLLNLISSKTLNQGQLVQSWDHLVEAVYAGAQPVPFKSGIGIY